MAEQFSQARLTKQFSLKTCAVDLDIQQKYLEYLETSNFESLPGEAYAKHWVKQYAEYLGMSPRNCLEKYLREKNIKHKLVEPEPETVSSNPSRKIFRSVFSRLNLRSFIIGIIILALVGYLGIFMFQTFEPPKISFNPPLTDQKTQDDSLIIAGQTEPGVQLWFNEQTILVNNDGTFNQQIPLAEGLNILTIRAKKKHSRTFEETIQIVKNSLPELINNQ